MEKTSFKVYVTKYALTQGVFEFDAVFGYSKESVHGASNTTRHTYYVLGHDCFRTLEEANKKAEAMRLKEIKRLQGKLAKLEALTFNANHSE